MRRFLQRNMCRRGPNLATMGRMQVGRVTQVPGAAPRMRASALVHVDAGLARHASQGPARGRSVARMVWAQPRGAVQRRCASQWGSGGGGASSSSSTTAGRANWKWGAIGLLGGLGALAISGGGFASAAAVPEDERALTSDASSTVRQTYGYLLAALGATAASAVVLFRTGVAHRFMAMGMLPVMGISLVGTLGLGMATRSIDFHSNWAAKHATWLGYCGFQGLMMAPLSVLGGPLLMTAAMGTAGVVGAISLLAMSAPPETYMNLMGPLAIGMGVTFGAGIGSMFFPGSSLLYSVFMYLGLAVHGGMVFSHTQRILDQASKSSAAQLAAHDPINDSIGIYMHTLAIFYRLVMMLSNGSNRRR